MQYEPRPIPGHPGYLIHPDGSIFKGRRRIKVWRSPTGRRKARLRNAAGKAHQVDIEAILRPQPAVEPPPPMDYPEGTPPDLAALLDELRASKRRVGVVWFSGQGAEYVSGWVRLTQTVGKNPQLVLSPGGHIDPRDITRIETPKGKVLYDIATQH